MEDEPDWRSYDRVADDYERVHAPRTGMVAADLVELAGVRPGDRVLDVGTGTGVVARAAARAAGPGLVVGVDASLPMLRVARRAGGGVGYARAQAIDLPFRDGTFDVELSAFTITHFPKYETALFDMLRVLRGGGRFGAATWGRTQDEFSRAWTEVAEAFAGRELVRDAYQRAMPWRERFADPGRLKEALYESGVRQLHVDRREYRFELSAEEYLVWQEISSLGRFLHQVLGERLWERFRSRTREVFGERFPPAFNDFRDVLLAVGVKPQP